MAPDAPTMGMFDAGSMAICVMAAASPAEQVKKHIAKMTDRVFDVVAENPEGQHVAPQVRPAGVHEHAVRMVGALETGAKAKRCGMNPKLASMPEYPASESACSQMKKTTLATISR